MMLRKIVASWDFLLAIAVAAGVAIYSPSYIRSAVAKDLYGVAISIIAIVFAVFFAALALIMSSSDDDFVYFLEQDASYSRIVWSFRFTLILLFAALLFSIVEYEYASFRLDGQVLFQAKWFLVVFSFISLYALFAAFAAALDSISYAKYRSKFILTRRSTTTGANSHLNNSPANRENPVTDVFSNHMNNAQRQQIVRGYNVASDIRKFEIELFWKRSLFFWGFIAATLIALAALKGEQPTLGLLLACFGFVCSLIWTLANRGSKYWQEQWETKIKNLEPSTTGPLFATREPQQDKGLWLSGRRYSVSKLAIAVSDFVVLVWIFILIRQGWICVEFPSYGKLSKWAAGTALAGTAVFALLISFLGRSTPRTDFKEPEQSSITPNHPR